MFLFVYDLSTCVSMCFRSGSECEHVCNVNVMCMFGIRLFCRNHGESH